MRIAYFLIFTLPFAGLAFAMAGDHHAQSDCMLQAVQAASQLNELPAKLIC